MFTVEPIGYFHTTCTETYEVPRQASLSHGNEGVIELKPGCQFEQGLEGLEGFDRIWVVYRFHRNTSWKPKVLPPRGGKKQGVFATRSPHRPNFIGFSCVELISVKGLKLSIVNHDLIDGTPILDLKPYLNYADAVTASRQGWLEELEPERELNLIWSECAQEQVDYLEMTCNLTLKSAIENRLKISPLPYPNNRIKQVGEKCYELAYRTWRIYFRIDENDLRIESLTSGYDRETLKGSKTSRWDDVPIHQAFIQHFS
jgi:tRNA (adenine37-N6)-methyltransferase